MRDIGKNIKTLRERNKLTQEELAEQLFVTRQTVSNYETGRTRPDIDMLRNITQVLGTDVNSVLYGVPVPEDRKMAYRRMVLCGAVLALLVIASALLRPLAKQS